MPRIFYSNRVNTTQGPSYINPLLLRRYAEEQLLVLCSDYDAASELLDWYMSEAFPYKKMVLLVIHWDEAEQFELHLQNPFLADELSFFSGIVFLDAANIPAEHQPLYQAMLQLSQAA